MKWGLNFSYKRVNVGSIQNAYNRYKQNLLIKISTNAGVICKGLTH